MTVYDLMEAKGIFAQNPANVGSMTEDGSPLYQGPVPYPCMFYHPQGEVRVTVPGRVEPSPTGPIHIPDQFEIIWELAKNAEDEQRLRDEGWHDHPAKAIASAKGQGLEWAKNIPIPAMSSDQRIRSLEAEIERLTAMANAVTPTPVEPPQAQGNRRSEQRAAAEQAVAEQVR
jgi:hypothetical protein